MPENLKVDGKMNVHLISPTHTVLDGVADKVLLPTWQGNLMVLMDRAPLFTVTQNGAMWVYNKGSRPKCYLISTGIAEIRRNICSVLAWGVDADEIDKDRIHMRLESAEQDLARVHSEIERAQVQDRVDFFKYLLDKPSLMVPPDFSS